MHFTSTSTNTSTVMISLGATDHSPGLSNLLSRQQEPRIPCSPVAALVLFRGGNYPNPMAKTISKLSDLAQDDRNPNRHTERGQEMTRKSLTELGFADSLTVDKNGKVISGNSRAALLEGTGAGEPIVVVSDGTRPVIHQRTDLDLDTDERARLLSVAMNRTHEVSLEWDAGVLAELVGEGVDLSDLWKGAELDALLNAAGASEGISGQSEHDIPADNYKEQYGVIVICAGESEQEEVYTKLASLGYNCKVVVT